MSVFSLIPARVRDIGGFTVHRSLPFARRRMVGPFIYWDHMGPVQLEPGHGMDVLPHPHINLATVTYLFEGEIVHKDSLARSVGSATQLWMPCTTAPALRDSAPERSEWTIPRPAVIRFTSPGWIARSEPEERIERAKREWKAGAFPKVPGDDVELVPLPG